MTEWEKVEVGSRVEIRTPDGSFEAQVTEVGSRLPGADGTDPGWARVKLDDGSETVVSQVSLARVVTDD